jgi:hypothetical protein
MASCVEPPPAHPVNKALHHARQARVIDGGRIVTDPAEFSRQIVKKT